MYYLLTTSEEEFIRIDAIFDGASDERDPVEDQWRLICVLEQQLAQDIQDNSKCNEGHNDGGENST